MQLPNQVRDFISNIKDVKFFCAEGTLPEGCKLYATRDAARDAALNAARDAALNATRDAAWYAALNAARDATRDAARYAALNAALDVARDVALEAALDAARNAALLSVCLLVKDSIAPDHLANAAARWRAWEAGYSVYCDVDGVLYCYKRP